MGAGDIRLAGDSQFEPWCVCTLPTSHLPPPTAAKYSSPTCVRTHLIPGEQANSPARPKPTEQASWEGSQGPPCPPLRRRASDRQESVPIKVLESGPRAAMQQGLCRQAQHVGSPSDSRGDLSLPHPPHPPSPAHSHITPEAETT